MIHPASTISAIIRSLRSIGIKDTEIIEEMTDHYLTEIEMLMDKGLDEQEAIKVTIGQIKSTSLHLLRSRRKSIWPHLVATLMLLGTVSIYFMHRPASPISEDSSTITDVAPSGWPIAKPKAEVTSHFGHRIHPVTKLKKLHRGIDIKAPIGTPVVATGDAMVKKIGFNKRAGRFIILKHGDRYTTRYHHLSAISVAEGDVITKGTIIGKSGNSGISMAPHLHYEIIDENAPIDPMECIGV